MNKCLWQNRESSPRHAWFVASLSLSVCPVLCPAVRGCLLREVPVWWLCFLGLRERGRHVTLMTRDEGRLKMSGSHLYMMLPCPTVLSKSSKSINSNLSVLSFQG